ncbi:MAG: flagellar protein FliS [Lachnospiraceae bacterium]|nr:flagellar protein FliS [Lachnospiraceae bacterium]
MKKEKKQEFTLRITKANKTQMIIILYDMVLEYLKDSLKSLEEEEYKEFKWNIERAKDCLDELLNSLNLEYEIAGILRGLYFFYKRELTTAKVYHEKKNVLIVMEMIQELKESYEKISKEDTSAPIMENTQSVYAGLTYGKDSLNVDLSDQNTKRGFCV